MDQYLAPHVKIFMNTILSISNVGFRAIIYHTMPGLKTNVSSVVWEHTQMQSIKLARNAPIIAIIAGSHLMWGEDNLYVAYAIQTSLLHQIKCVRNNAILLSTLIRVFQLQIAKIVDLNVPAVQMGILVTYVNLNLTFKAMEAVNSNVLTQRLKCGIRKSNNVKLLYLGYSYFQLTHRQPSDAMILSLAPNF